MGRAQAEGVDERPDQQRAGRGDQPPRRGEDRHRSQGLHLRALGGQAPAPRARNKKRPRRGYLRGLDVSTSGLLLLQDRDRSLRLVGGQRHVAGLARGLGLLHQRGGLRHVSARSLGRSGRPSGRPRRLDVLVTARRLDVLVATMRLDILVAAGRLHVLVATGRLDVLVATGRLDILVTAGRLVILDGAGRLDILVTAGRLDVLVAAGRLDILVAARRLDILVTAGRLHVLVAAGRLDILVAARRLDILVTAGRLHVLVAA